MAPKRSMQNKKEKSYKKQKVVEEVKLSPVDQNIQVLCEAIHDVEKYQFPVSDFLSIMVPTCFAPLVENRHPYFHQVAGMVGRSMEEAKKVLEANKEALLYDVNNVEQVKAEHEKTLAQIEEEIRNQDIKIEELKEAKFLAEEKNNEGSRLYDEEVAKVEEKNQEFRKHEESHETILRCRDDVFIPSLSEPPTNKNKKEQAFKNIFKTFFEGQESLLNSLPNALFKDITMRTEFEVMTLQLTDKLFNEKLQEIKQMMDELKPDTTKRDELSEASMKLGNELDIARTALKTQQNCRKELGNRGSEIKKMLKDYPKQVEMKENELKAVEGRITSFAEKVIPAYEFLLNRTEIVVPEVVPEEEEVKQETAVKEEGSIFSVRLVPTVESLNVDSDCEIVEPRVVPMEAQDHVMRGEMPMDKSPVDVRVGSQMYGSLTPQSGQQVYASHGLPQSGAQSETEMFTPKTAKSGAYTPKSRLSGMSMPHEENVENMAADEMSEIVKHADMQGVETPITESETDAYALA